MPETINLEVTRYSPESDSEPRTQQYEVPLREEWVVLDALNYVKNELDGSLSYRWSCRMGVCCLVWLPKRGARLNLQRPR